MRLKTFKEGLMVPKKKTGEGSRSQNVMYNLLTSNNNPLWLQQLRTKFYSNLKSGRTLTIAIPFA